MQSDSFDSDAFGEPPENEAEEHPRRVWAQLAASHWVRSGRSGATRIVYVFSDPECDFCLRFWRSSRPWVAAGGVQIRYLLVGLFGPTSIAETAAVLTAPAPEKALASLYNASSPHARAALGDREVSPAVRATLKANDALMRELGFHVVPGIVVRSANGRLQLWPGLPAPTDMPDVLGPRPH